MATFRKPSATAIAQDIAMESVDESGAAIQLTAEFGYESGDPYAISATFGTTHGDVHWSFARELLSSGLLEPSGEGDVHIWPTLSSRGSAAVIVELRSPSGSALLQASSGEISQFLSLTHALVEPGMEANHLDLDGVIELMLASATDAAQQTVEAQPVPSSDRPD
jgi:hypothetical protein